MPAGLLSYGKHRSLEISMALATNPDLILLDEPTAGMSRDETHNAVEMIKRLTGAKPWSSSSMIWMSSSPWRTALRFSITGRF